MQELKHHPQGRFKNSKGSILLLAVVIAMIMAITGVAFLTVTTHTLNNDSSAFRNEKALQACESGLMLASKWLIDHEPRTWKDWNTTPGTGFITFPINGFWVEVKVTAGPSTGLPDSAVVKAEAYTSSTTHDATTFVKRVKHTINNFK